MRNAAIVIQTYARRYIAQRRLSQLKKIAQYENWAANCIQKHWRCYQMSQWFTNLRRSVVNFQSHCRGYLLRSRMNEIADENTKARNEAKANSAKRNSVSISIRTTPPVSLHTGKIGRLFFMCHCFIIFAYTQNSKQNHHHSSDLFLLNHVLSHKVAVQACFLAMRQFQL